MQILRTVKQWWSALRNPQPATIGYDPQPHYGIAWQQKLPPFSLWSAERMLRDHQVSFGVAINNAPLFSAEIEVEGPAEVATFVKDQWDKMWSSYAPQLLRPKYFGFTGYEVLYEECEGRLEFKSLRDFMPLDAAPLSYGGKLVGVRVRRLKSVDGVATDGWADLPRGKGLWLTYGAEYGRYFGRAILERAYPPWFEKVMDSGAIDLRRLRMVKDAWVGDVILYPMGKTATDSAGNIVSLRDALREAVEFRQSGGVLTLPKIQDESGVNQIEYIPPTPVSGASQILEWIKTLDEDIFDGLEVPKEVVEAAATGSGFSGRSIPFISFLAMRDQEFGDKLHQIDTQVLQTLVWLNFGATAAKSYKITPVPLLTTVGKLMGPMGQPNTSESMIGGAGDGRPDSAFSQRSLSPATRLEMEHTGDRAIAEEIAKDHLTEDPDYYRKLRKVEQFSVKDAEGNLHSETDGRFVSSGSGAKTAPKTQEQEDDEIDKRRQKEDKQRGREAKKAIRKKNLQEIRALERRKDKEESQLEKNTKLSDAEFKKAQDALYGRYYEELAALEQRHFEEEENAQYEAEMNVPEEVAKAREEEDKAITTRRLGKTPQQLSVADRLRAPVGGATIKGKDYRGGMFIPKEVVAKMTEKEKQDVREGKAKPSPEPAKASEDAKPKDAKPKKPKSPPKLPADKPVPKPVKQAVQTKAAQAMRLAYEVMRSPHADYTDFRTALKDAWAHIKGEMTILYRDEDFKTSKADGGTAGKQPEPFSDTDRYKVSKSPVYDQWIFKSNDGKEIGEIQLKKRLKDDQYVTANVLVWPEFQRKGYATDFYRNAAEWAQKQGKRLYLSQDRSSDAKELHKFFQSKGWLSADGELFPKNNDQETAAQPKERRTIEAQEVMARLARMRGRKPVQMSADADTLTDEEHDLLRLFAALELEDDDAEREEITREIVELMGEMFEEGE